MQYASSTRFMLFQVHLLSDLCQRLQLFIIPHDRSSGRFGLRSTPAACPIEERAEDDAEQHKQAKLIDQFQPQGKHRSGKIQFKTLFKTLVG